MFQYPVALALFIFISSNAFAQQFNAGIKAGVTASQISGDQLGGYDKAGLMAGGYVGMPLSQKFDLALEILYIQKGSKKNSNPDKGDYDYYRLRLNYFEFPLFLKWKFSKRFVFEGGITYGVLVKQTEEDAYGELPNRREFNKGEFGFGGGLLVNFAKQFSFTSRIETSLLPVREHVSGETYYFNKGQYNAAITFGLQYNFGKNNNQ